MELRGQGIHYCQPEGIRALARGDPCITACQPEGIHYCQIAGIFSPLCLHGNVIARVCALTQLAPVYLLPDIFPPFLCVYLVHVRTCACGMWYVLCTHMGGRGGCQGCYSSWQPNPQPHGPRQDVWLTSEFRLPVNMV